MNNMPTKSELNELFSYDYLTGELRWKLSNRNNQIKENDIAGYKNTNGYIYVRINRKAYTAQRLIWVMINGEIPYGFEIDHINCIRSDNKIVNLRCVSTSDNQQNRKKAQKNNKLKVLGVRKSSPNRYRAQITVAGKTLYLGSFVTIEEAHNAYLTAKRQFHPGNTL